MEPAAVQCKQCTYTAITQGLLDDHIKQFHMEPASESFRCPRCPYPLFFISSRLLDHHIKKFHKVPNTTPMPPAPRPANNPTLEYDFFYGDRSHCEIVNLDEFWNPLMDAVTKRLEQTKDEKLKKDGPEAVLVGELTQVTEKGFKKVDYLNNGIVVLKLISKRKKTKNPRTGTKHDAFLQSIPVVALRIGVEEWGNTEIQILQLLGIYDETIEDQKDAYKQKLKELRGDSEEPKRSGYFNGRPCHEGADDNPEPRHYICAPPLPVMQAGKI